MHHSIIKLLFFKLHKNLYFDKCRIKKLTWKAGKNQCLQISVEMKQNEENPKCVQLYKASSLARKQG